MISAGNTKLGQIANFSLRSIETCPGRSKLCEKVCYAAKGLYNMPSVQEVYTANWEFAKSAAFVDRMVQEIEDKRIRLMRIHASGDFKTAAYANKWMQIVKRAKHTRFFVYTRSWRVPEIASVLWSMSRLSNMALWLSCDKETGSPPKWHSVRLAYMSTSDEDMPQFPVDLVFRDNDSTPMVRDPVSGTLVCPYEQGIERSVKITCSSCQLCFNKARMILARPGVTKGSRK